MIAFSLLDFLIDWLGKNFEISILTIEYPEEGNFRRDSLFTFGYYNGEFFIELFFNVLIGAKNYE